MRIVVIGAGVVGASIAYQLARRAGVEVTVLDRAKAGTGASGHSFAWTNAFNKQPRHYHDFNRRSMEMWHRFVADLGVTEALTPGGNLLLENTPERGEALSAQVRQLQAWGYPSRMVDPSELIALEPALADHDFTAACFSPHEAHVDVPPVVQACLDRAQAAGASLIEECGPVALRQVNARIEAVSAGDTLLACDAVVVAAGTETPVIASQVGVTIPRAVSPGIVIRTDRRPPLLRSVALVHLPAIDVSRPEIHLRQLPDGTLHMGQGTQESLDRDDSQAHAEDLLGRATHYFPALAGARAIAQPVGYRPMPEDGLPVMGYATEAPNLYLAMMHSGVTLAPLVGELAALEIVNGTAVEWLNPYRPDRFKT